MKALEKKIKKKGFFMRLLPFNRPYLFIIFAVIGSAVQGVMMPIFGWFYVKILFNTLTIDMDSVEKWILLVLILAAISFTATYVYKVLFGIVGENMTKIFCNLKMSMQLISNFDRK